MDGKLELSSVPMMIPLTFNGAVTGETVDKVYNKLFRLERVNPNGCTAKGTFFVSHKYTNYSAVQVDRNLVVRKVVLTMICRSCTGLVMRLELSQLVVKRIPTTGARGTTRPG